MGNRGKNNDNWNKDVSETKVWGRVRELKKDIYKHEEAISKVEKLLSDKSTDAHKSELRKERRMLYDKYKELLQEFNKYAVKGKTCSVNRKSSGVRPPISDSPVDGAIYKDKELKYTPEYKEYANKINTVYYAMEDMNKRIKNIDECLKYEFLSNESKNYLLNLRKEYVYNWQSYSAQMRDFAKGKNKYNALKSKEKRQENIEEQTDEKIITTTAKKVKDKSKNNSSRKYKSAGRGWITTRVSVWPVGWSKKR